MPELVKKCIKSWKIQNPTYTIHMIHKDNLVEYVPINWDDMIHVTSQQFKSDVIRLYVLAERGGVWMDASVYLNKSLDWIHSYQSNTSCDFIGYKQNSFRNYPIIESWFIACVPNSRFVTDWKDEFFKIHSHSTITSYITSLEQNGIKLDFLHNKEYLSVYASVQALIQKKNNYNIQLLNGNGPLAVSLMFLYPFFPIFYNEPVIKYYNWNRSIAQKLGLYHFL
jgi:mannosyltransferase OCH1-like enzyme